MLLNHILTHTFTVYIGKRTGGAALGSWKSEVRAGIFLGQGLSRWHVGWWLLTRVPAVCGAAWSHPVPGTRFSRHFVIILHDEVEDTRRASPNDGEF